MNRVAFLGLGVMGFPMAGHLAAKGYDVTVYNRTAAKSENWVANHGGSMAKTPREAVEDAEIVFACVGNDDDLRSICVGEDGVFAGMADGAIFVDHTSVTAVVTKEMADLAAEAGIQFVDAPVSGGQAGADQGVLSIMCGGAPEIYATVEPVLASYASVSALIGPVGSGQLAKMANQIAIAGVVQGLSEALRFIEKAGLDGRRVVEVIQHGAAGSWQMSNRYETMLDDVYEHGFAVDWMRKDLANCLSTGNDIGASLPLTALVDQFYHDVQKLGGGRWDTSSLKRRL